MAVTDPSAKVTESGLVASGRAMTTTRGNKKFRSSRMISAIFFASNSLTEFL